MQPKGEREKEEGKEGCEAQEEGSSHWSIARSFGWSVYHPMIKLEFPVSLLVTPAIVDT